MTYTGSCLCGMVTYKITAPLRDTVSCHCSRCRRTFSAQASAMAFIEPGSFQWTAGTDNLTRYTNKQGYGVQFCASCGSTLATIHKDTVIQISLGCLDQNPDLAIDRHIFVGSKARWEELPNGATCFDGPKPITD